MKFKVKEGQSLPHRGEDGVRRVLKGGDVVEGPEQWVADFSGTLEPLEPLQGGSLEMATLLKDTRAHERVSILEGLLAGAPDRQAELEPLIAKAKQESADDEKVAREETAPGAVDAISSGPSVRAIATPVADEKAKK